MAFYFKLKTTPLECNSSIINTENAQALFEEYIEFFTNPPNCRYHNSMFTSTDFNEKKGKSTTWSPRHYVAGRAQSLE
jgi:hypothetical protein